jgi:hypothetical protein
MQVASGGCCDGGYSNEPGLSEILKILFAVSPTRRLIGPS